MNRLLVVGLFIFLSTLTQAQAAENCTPLPLVNHMRELSYVADKMFAIYDDSSKETELANLTAQMRQHLIANLSLSPTKLNNMPELNRRSALLDYQDLMSEMVVLSIKLEKAILTKPITDDGLIKRKKFITDTLMRMSQIIGQGHNKFRN